MNNLHPPDPLCSFCAVGKPCVFHAFVRGAEQARKFVEFFKKKGVLVLARMLEEAFARIQAPMEASGFLASFSEIPLDPLQDEMARILDQDQLSVQDLKKLASVALALAFLAEDGDEHDVAT